MVDSIQHTQSTSAPGGGIIGSTISASVSEHAGDKYDKPLRIIEPELNPTERFKKLYIDAFSAKGKEIIVLNERLDKKRLDSLPKAKIVKPNSESEKVYYKKDLRFLKQKYGIDEVLIVHIQYGVSSEFSYAIETSRNAQTYVHPEIVSVKDNSILFRNNYKIKQPLQRNWDVPPDYEMLKKCIQATIDRAFIEEQKKYK